LTDYPTLVRLIGKTRTQTGLRVNCGLSTKFYPTETKVSDVQMGERSLLKPPTLPNWNYTRMTFSIGVLRVEIVLTFVLTLAIFSLAKKSWTEDNTVNGSL